MKKVLFIAIIVFSSIIASSQDSKPTHHILNVNIDPQTSKISVVDTVFINGIEQAEFSLNASLLPTSFSDNVEATQTEKGAVAVDVGMDREEAENDDNALKLNKWVLEINKGSEFIVINYEGIIDSPIEQSEENYQRGFSESPGIINDLGIYLGGSTHWIPSFANGELITYKMTTNLPAGWKVVSQGERTLEITKDENHIDTWVCDSPQEEAFLIAARFNEFSHKMNSGHDAMAFLRTPDEGLANRYLEVTEQYMDMYERLIGAYPYSKFALVENFWETGYGMPSFTLLGEKIIRFPFILHSSYPHELLHNWWGNGVYVDFESGNWCEGLTAYMADHLIKEQRGQGENYRRSTLQKFTNVVNDSNDFPLNSFISRHDAPSEAIGYGKTLMMMHMLRQKLGDDGFSRSMALFYNDNKYKNASFDDIRKSAETISLFNLESFFDQWVNRTGAPNIAIKNIEVGNYNNKYRVSLTLEQKQTSDVFEVDVPIVIATEKGLETNFVNFSEREQNFQFMLDEKPLKLVVDPQYDVFRILHPKEVPPTWSKILASKQNLVVLPSEVADSTKNLYEEFVEFWKASRDENYEVVLDSDIDELPSDKTVWVIGFENKFADVINNSINAYSSSFVADSVIYEGKPTVKANHSFVLTVFNEKNVDITLSFIALDNQKSITGLIRKLPHYGKYSYLAFEGDEPTNVAKGQWPVFNSPLESVFDEEGKYVPVTEFRQALATLTPVFSENRMMKTVEYLASEELKGRGLGTPEIDEAASFIADKFKEYGLQTMGDSYYQEFTHEFADSGNVSMKNVIGVIPGTDPELKDAPVVISAHYDHLGSGWPDVRKGNSGKIHNGADDNASGVAVMLELIKTSAKSLKSARTVIFVAFTAEEAGLVGSRYFANNYKNYPIEKIIANLNLDSVGRIFGNKLMVINSNSAREWKFIFMGTEFTTGVATELITQDLDASDQVAFIEKGIPAVQFFVGPHQDYHKPTDDVEKIDPVGLVKTATVVKEVLLYLADRKEPMAFTGKAKDIVPSAGTPMRPSSGGKKAATGMMPDFAFSGDGVKVGGVSDDSPAGLAGIKKGDIIKSFEGKVVKDLKVYSKYLKEHKPGDTVQLTIERNGEMKKVELTLGER